MDVNLGENWNTASLRWDFCSSILSLFPLLVPVWSFHFLSSAFCYPTPVAATSDSDPGPFLWVSAQGPQPQPQPPPMGHLAVRAGPSFFSAHPNVLSAVVAQEKQSKHTLFSPASAAAAGPSVCSPHGTRGWLALGSTEWG